MIRELPHRPKHLRLLTPELQISRITPLEQEVRRWRRSFWLMTAAFIGQTALAVMLSL